MLLKNSPCWAIEELWFVPTSKPPQSSYFFSLSFRIFSSILHQSVIQSYYFVVFHLHIERSLMHFQMAWRD
jgi:hypothetical protein